MPGITSNQEIVVYSKDNILLEQFTSALQGIFQLKSAITSMNLDGLDLGECKVEGSDVYIVYYADKKVCANEEISASLHRLSGKKDGDAGYDILYAGDVIPNKYANFIKVAAIANI